MRHFSVLVLVLSALAFAGCGDEVDPVSGADAPAVTAPGTTQPFENGGADGSGADGSDAPEDRGGIAAGPDSDEPGAQ
jgi:hypothetical protein